MKLYSLEAVENLAAKYESKGGHTATIAEGTLLDSLIMYGTGLKTTICNVQYLNNQSSTYTVKSYNKTPKKYQHLLTN